VNNPLTILTTLDSFLQQETHVVLYGRSALALGYGFAGSALGVTSDVDVILPGVQMTAIETDSQMWKALAKTNVALEPRGLYITHLFTDDQVILTPDWLEKIVPIPLPGIAKLRAFRPSTVDLVLTKMMRDDPQDADDIEFLLRQEKIVPATLQEAFSRAKCPDVPEIRDTFIKLQPGVLTLAGRIAEI
jgi:hypothetical protein